MGTTKAERIRKRGERRLRNRRSTDVEKSQAISQAVTITEMHWREVLIRSLREDDLEIKRLKEQVKQLQEHLAFYQQDPTCGDPCSSMDCDNTIGDCIHKA